MTPNESEIHGKPRDTRLRARFTVEVDILGMHNCKISDATREMFNGRDLEELSENETWEIWEQMRKDTDYNWEPLVSVSTEIVEDQCDSERPLGRWAKRQFDYLIEHFAEEARAIVIRMLMIEHTVKEFYRVGPDVGSNSRKSVIQSLLERSKERITRRLPKQIGRPRDEERYHYPRERKEFFFKLVSALEIMEKKELQLNKTNLAEEIYPSEGDDQINEPAKVLSQQMKKYKISMEQLLKYHRGEDRSLSMFRADEMDLLRRTMQ